MKKKTLKNTFPGKKNTTVKKKHKKHFCFLKTLSMRTVNTKITCDFRHFAL